MKTKNCSRCKEKLSDNKDDIFKDSKGNEICFGCFGDLADEAYMNAVDNELSRGK